MGIEVPEEGEITNGDLNYRDLIKYIDDGSIHIPEFQREFVWNEQKILDLLDSIYKNYPIGSLIFWVTNEDFTYSAPIGDGESSSSTLKYRFFVIDGQQRLKSLYYAAKSEELEMQGGEKEIDVVFDLEEEKFILEGDIRDRKKSMYSVPGVKSDDMLMQVLEGVENNSLDDVQENLDLGDSPLDGFLSSLVDINILSETEEDYELTPDGEHALENRDYQYVANILVNQTKFIKETLEIIQENPGITRNGAKPEFQEIYGGSSSTAYHEFGKRCKWLRPLQLIRKEDGGYYITDSGEAILDDIQQTEKEIESRFIPLEQILVDQSDLDFEYLSKFSEERREKLNHLRKVFHDYDFSIILANKADWEAVCDIFERINTKGQTLTVVDLMIAKTWSGQEFNLRDELAKFKDEIGEDLPDITILQAVSLNIAGRCRRQDILGLDSEEVKEEWEDVIESIKKSIDFLDNNLSLPTLDLLPYPAQVVPLSRFFYLMGNKEPSQEQKQKLIRWFWKSAISNRFDSAVASKLEEDGQSMEEIVKEEPVEFKYSYIQRTAEDIIDQNYSLRNAFVKTIICLFASQNPANPVNNAPVSHDNFSKYKQTEMHHIFPRNYLRTQGVEDEMINSIANIMFLPANINKSSDFSDSPQEYLNEIDNPQLEDALETHLIPNLDESGLMENNYDRFLNYRAQQILNKLEEVTGEEDISGGARALSPETPFTNEMNIRELVRKSDSYLYWFDKYFTRKGLEYIIQEIDTDDIDEVRILTGTPQTDHNLRADFERFKEELEEKGINAEMRVISGDTAAEIHDRWLISENHAYNIPSINTIGRGQYAEITEAASRPPFEEWWNKGNDILEDWNEVQRIIN
ncbi:GmrSD restriction endonuclease domain-containing protein [Haloplanus halobius]|uniref:GmrSD restriction endonuclease domain-containing protein n=1 Tax=Haloplanus halobius TaxID=2934938 RepID=UPI00200D74CB|nr:DUF262 domain-containing protein [Haloplanus sp. XH21]